MALPGSARMLRLVGEGKSLIRLAHVVGLDNISPVRTVARPGPKVQRIPDVMGGLRREQPRQVGEKRLPVGIALPVLKELAEYQERLLHNIFGLEGAVTVGDTIEHTDRADHPRFYRWEVAQVEAIAGLPVATLGSQGQVLIRCLLKLRIALTQFSVSTQSSPLSTNATTAPSHIPAH